MAAYQAGELGLDTSVDTVNVQRHDRRETRILLTRSAFEETGVNCW